MLYRLLYAVLLRRIDPERAHRLALGALRRATPLLRLLPRRGDPVLEVRALGRVHRSPLGVAAGVDKDGRAFEGLGLLGFGHVEVGTVTPAPQPGNDRPRVFRRPGERALVNRMGFPNDGAEAVAARLGRRHRDGLVVGANVSKGRDLPPESAAEAAARLAPLADYVVVNVSSPNTPGLRDLQQVDALRALLGAVRAAVGDTPLLVKISPDLADEDVAAIADLARELRLDGIVATNTTVAHGGPPGGLSGPPLRDRSLAVLRLVRARVGDELAIVSVGGVESAADVWERIVSGASLVQAYTALVYGGPLWPRRVNRELSRLARDAGYARVEDAVGVRA